MTFPELLAFLFLAGTALGFAAHCVKEGADFDRRNG